MSHLARLSELSIIGSEDGKSRFVKMEDRNHARLARKGFTWSANCLKSGTADPHVSPRAVDADYYVQTYKRQGFEVVVCQIAYDRDGNLLPDVVSIWRRKRKNRQ